MLLVNERFGKFSGAEQHLYVTLPYIKNKFNIHFLYNEDTQKSTDQLRESIVNEVKVDFEDESKNTFVETLKLLKKIKPEIIYVHKCMNIQMLKAFRFFGVPLIRMQHDHDMYCMRSYKYNPLTRHICTKKAGLGCVFPCMASLKRDRSKGSGFSWVSYFKQMQQIEINKTFDEVFVVTNYMKEELIRQDFHQDKIFIFPPVPVEKNNLPVPQFSDENILVFATQIIRGKGLDCLLKALSMVKNDFKLYIFGEGSHKEACIELTKELKLEEKVFFKGFVPQEELSAIYENATLGTVPSVWPEPIATVGLEFLRHGLPVVGFDAGGIKDWLKDDETGYLIPWMDIEKMAEKIDLLLTDKTLARKLGKQGKDFVNREYNFGNYINKLVNHLVDVVENIHFEAAENF